jgi:glycosyltransferase involved in cell wall biosynthesis
VDRLLRAFARAGVKEARLLVVGGGPERESLGQLSRELGIDGQVEFAGHLPPDECRQRLERGRIQVVPSIWEEPYGMTAVEGMAQGRAVVVSRRCGAARHVATGERLGRTRRCFGACGTAAGGDATRHQRADGDEARRRTPGS